MEKLPDGLGLAKNVPDFDYLLRLSSQNRNKLPTVPAVYFLHTTTNLIIYIGSTINLRQRLASYGHWFQTLAGHGISPVLIAWLPVSSLILRGLEDELIQVVKPPLNGVHKGLKEGRTHSYEMVAAMERERRRIR